MDRSLKIFTWPVHGNYLYYFANLPHEIYIPVKPGRPPGYTGRTGDFCWPPNLYEIPVNQIRDIDLDCVVFQSEQHYLYDQYEVLSQSQRQLPQIYIEHNPPRQSPTDTVHVASGNNILIVHVTAFNALMWDNQNNPTHIIEHGVTIPSGIRYSGELERGIVVVNNLADRGRRLGADVFLEVQKQVPLHLVGIGSERLGGLGEISPPHLPEFISHYRFFFNPIRYTSLGLAVCEAMMIGLPIVGLATTEMVTAIDNGKSGYIDTRTVNLIEYMRLLLADYDLARRLGTGACRTAHQRFNIGRFVKEWEAALLSITKHASVREN
jgi:glycosyltransferase involved in cell wall biosynthesis